MDVTADKLLWLIQFDINAMTGPCVLTHVTSWLAGRREILVLFLQHMHRITSCAELGVH